MQKWAFEETSVMTSADLHNNLTYIIIDWLFLYGIEKLISVREQHKQVT